jgi:hypothetical protein
MLVVLISQILECLNVLNLIENLSKVFHYVCAKQFDVFKLDKLEKFKDGRLQEVVASVVADEGLDNWCKKISLDNISERIQCVIIYSISFCWHNLPIVKIILH